jgi:hypothetical protein
MNIIGHYQENKKLNMSLWCNLKDIFFHLHNGKKRILACLTSLIVNYLAYKHCISINEWIVLLSTEYIIIEMMKALTSEVTL